MPANRPSAAELLVAIREYLEQDIKVLLADVDGLRTAEESSLKSLSFNNAIAINLLKLLERETLQRTAQIDEEVALLRTLVTKSSTSDDPDVLNSALIDMIEAAEFSDPDKRVLRVLQQIGLSKLAIDNPAYSTLRLHRG
jgi:hypothetical protein